MAPFEKELNGLSRSGGDGGSEAPPREGQTKDEEWREWWEDDSSLSGRSDGQMEGGEGAPTVAPLDGVDFKLEDLGLGGLRELEAIATVKFYGSTFCKELFYHVFFPATVPFVMVWEGGMLGLMNRLFIHYSSTALRPFILQLIMSLCFWLLNIVSFMYVKRAKNFIYLYDVFIVDILWLLRCAVVSTKYAFTSKLEMQEMRERVLPREAHERRTLLRVWKDPMPIKILKRELLLAAARLKLVLRHANFRLEGSATSADALLDMLTDLQAVDGVKRSASQQDLADQSASGEVGNDWLREGADSAIFEPVEKAESGGQLSPTLLPVKLYAAHVIYQASSITRLRRLGHTLLSEHLTWCALVLAIVHAVLPLSLRAVFGGHDYPGPRWTHYVIAATSFILVGYSMWSGCAFMMVGVLDFRRRHYAAEQLDELLYNNVYTGSKRRRRPRGDSFLKRIRSGSDGSVGLLKRVWSGSDMSSGSVTWPGIAVDFTDPDSLQAWWVCRQLTQEFGHGFFMRIKYYTTYYAVYCGVLLFFMALRLLYGITNKDIYLIVTVLFSVDVFLFLLALMVWPGGETNTLRAKHGATLTMKKMGLEIKIREQRSTLPPETLQKYRASVDIISQIMSAVRWDNGKTQLSVVGFQAGEQLTAFIVAVVSSTILLGIEQVVQNYYSHN